MMNDAEKRMCAEIAKRYDQMGEVSKETRRESLARAQDETDAGRRAALVAISAHHEEMISHFYGLAECYLALSK